MDVESRDKALRVMRKLSALSDLFTFYWFAHDRADFQKDSITGLSDIVSDCIGELGEIAKGEPGQRPLDGNAGAEGP